MMKHKMITTLAIAALATASIGVNAFAAAGKQEAYYETVKGAAKNEREIPQSEVKDCEYGSRYYEADDDILMITVDAEEAGKSSMKMPQKTDENGNTYIELEDGSRVYVSSTNSYAE